MRFRDIREQESEAALDALATISKRFLDDDPEHQRPLAYRLQYEVALANAETALGRPHITLSIPWDDLHAMAIILDTAHKELAKRLRAIAQLRASVS